MFMQVDVVALNGVRDGNAILERWNVHEVSASIAVIAVYRIQTRFFDGKSDGKFYAPRKGSRCNQSVIGAGEN